VENQDHNASPVGRMRSTAGGPWPASSTVGTYNPDGTWTCTERGPVITFSEPGVGIVFCDAFG